MIKSRIEKITNQEFTDRILKAIEKNIENSIDDKALVAYAKMLYKAYKVGYKVYYREPHYPLE